MSDRDEIAEVLAAHRSDMGDGWCDCGREIVAPSADQQIVASGGWSAPSESVYEIAADVTPMCSDCRARLTFISEIGFDPGPDGENLRVPRGGVTYPRPTDE